MGRGNLKPETGNASGLHSSSCYSTLIFRFQVFFLLLPHLEHDAGGGAGAVHGDGIVDLLEREGVGDEAVETHFAGLDEVNEPWYF